MWRKLIKNLSWIKKRIVQVEGMPKAGTSGEDERLHGTQAVARSGDKTERQARKLFYARCYYFVAC